MEPNTPELMDSELKISATPPAEEASVAKISLSKRAAAEEPTEEAPAARISLSKRTAAEEEPAEEAPAAKVSLSKRATAEEEAAAAAPAAKISLTKSIPAEEAADEEEDEEDFEEDEAEEEEFTEVDEEFDPYAGFTFDENFQPSMEEDDVDFMVREPNPDAVVVLEEKEVPINAGQIGKFLAALGVITAGVAVLALLMVYLVAPFTAKFCDYTAAKKLMEAGSYMDAVSAFEDLDGFLNSEALIEECHEGQKQANYDAALAAREAGNYAKAMEGFLALKDFSDAPDQYRETAYMYGNKLVDLKKYEDAIEMYTKSGNFSDAEEKIKEAYYGMGKLAMINKDYLDAITAFEQSEKFSDAEALIQEAKIAYIAANPDVSDKNTAAFITEMEEKGVEGLEELLTEVYKWKAEIVAFNNSPDSASSNKSSISRKSPMCVHFKITGGKIDATVNIRAEITLPSGMKGNINFQDAKNGDVLMAYGTYDNPTYGATGTMTVKIYDANNNLLAEGSVKVY